MPGTPSERARQPLLDLREHIALIGEFVTGMDYAAFASDARPLHPTVRCLEVISEASRRLPEEMRARHPHLPWRAIMGAGNVYRHDYERVSPLLARRTVQDRPADLDAVVTSELDRAG